MHLLSVWMHKASSDSGAGGAGFSQSHLVSLGTKHTESQGETSPRFSDRVCFSIQKGSGRALFKMQLRKALEKIFVIQGGALNSQHNRSWLLKQGGKYLAATAQKKKKAGVHPVVSQNFLPDFHLLPHLKTAVQLYGAL